MKDKLSEMHEFIRGSYYLGKDNLSFGNCETNDFVLMSLLTSIIPGKELIMGHYGMGKTTVPEAVSSLVYGFPPELVKQCQVKGNPFLTEEKIIGRPDLAKLHNGGGESVVWSRFSRIEGPKIVDEINRIPEGGQNILLASADTGIFAYLNESLFMEQFPFYATANYPDTGNTGIIPPLADRFDILVEVGPPVGMTFYLESALENQGRLSNPKISEEMSQSILKGDSGGISELKKDYCEMLEANGVPHLNPEELYGIRREIDKIGIEPEVLIIRDVLFSEANSITKVPGEPSLLKDLRYEGTFAGETENNLSVRWLKSVTKYAQALAWAAGEDAVTPEIFMETVPYTLAHRLYVSDTFARQNTKDEHYPGSQQSYSAKVLSEDFYRRYMENRDIYIEYYNGLTSGLTPKEGEFPDLLALRGILYRM